MDKDLGQMAYEARFSGERADQAGPWSEQPEHVRAIWADVERTVIIHTVNSRWRLMIEAEDARPLGVISVERERGYNQREGFFDRELGESHGFTRGRVPLPKPIDPSDPVDAYLIALAQGKEITPELLKGQPPAGSDSSRVSAISEGTVALVGESLGAFIETLHAVEVDGDLPAILPINLDLAPGGKHAGMGFTGEACRDCASFAMVRTGTCSTCQACGSTGGCG